MNHGFFTKLKEKNPTLPSNLGKAWTTGEEDTMLDMISYGISHEDIANKLERTRGAIRSRLLMIAKVEVKAGASLDDAFNMTKISIETIQRALDMEPKSKQVNITTKPVVVEENIIDVMKEIRDLLKQLNSKL